MNLTTVNLTFSAQNTTGTYTLAIGAGTLDAASNSLGANAVTETFSKIAVVSGYYDFGTATSPVAATYTSVNSATAYGRVSQAYGWLPTRGEPRSSGFDTGITDIPDARGFTRDFNYTTNATSAATAATFAADVSNGLYDVTVTLGDARGYSYSNALYFQNSSTATFRGFTAEYGYIVARYAENLVRHHELTYNLGERVCAFTSPLHALLSALLAGMLGNAVFWPKMASLFATAGAFLAMLRGLRKDAFAVALCAAMVVPSPFIALWTIGGLETAFVLFLMTLLTLTARSNDRAPVWAVDAYWLGGLLISLGFLARFDTVGVFDSGRFLLALSRAIQSVDRSPPLIPGPVLLQWRG